jgi:hypothetical protein
VNGDGTINMVDISISINKFMTSGDTTRNVNVTNWTPSYKIDDYTGINYSWTNFGQLTYQGLMNGRTEGFSRMSVQITVYNWSTSSPTWVNVSCNSISWMIYPPTIPYASYTGSLLPFQPINFSSSWNPERIVGLSEVVETRAPIYSLYLNVQSQSQSGWVLMDVYVYLRNE